MFEDKPSEQKHLNVKKDIYRTLIKSSNPDPVGSGKRISLAITAKYTTADKQKEI